MESKYMRIGEVARITGLSQRIIRQWEKEFPMLKPLKRKGYRLYTEQDVELILTIKELYDKGLNREGIIKRLSAELSEEERGLLSIIRGIKKEVEEILREFDGSD